MTKKGIKRRSFLGAGFLGLGAVAGWLGSKKLETSRNVQKEMRTKGTPSAKPAVDLSEFQKVDHENLLYEFDGSFPTQMEHTKRVSHGPDQTLLVCGDQKLVLFDQKGNPKDEWLLPDQPHDASFHQDRIIVAFSDSIQTMDLKGNVLWKTAPFPEKTYFTSLAVNDQAIYIADAGHRDIKVCDHQGAFVKQFGKKDDATGNPGFVVPSGYFDLKITDQGLLQIANPGRLRIETWSLDGVFQSSWGHPGMALGRFCGCCNPVFFDVFSNGQFVTSEKGLSRICVFAPDGSLQGMAMAQGELVQDPIKMKQARNQQTAGVGFDVLVGQGDRLIICDPIMNEIRTFVPKRKS